MQIEYLADVTGGIMTPEHRAQVRQLARFRDSARIAMQRAAQEVGSTPPSTRPSEPRAAPPAGEDDGYNNNDNNNDGERDQSNGDQIIQAPDPLIYPGLYSPSGFNIMNILIRVRLRPNPKIDLGLVDSSCALVLCDFSLPDTPIVYASETFTLLTHYSEREILGKNCRFLQSPSGQVSPGVRREHTSNDTVREMKENLARREEHQVVVTNYKKGGERFENVLTVVPISWHDGGEVRFVVGFQVDERNCFLGPAVPPL